MTRNHNALAFLTLCLLGSVTSGCDLGSNEAGTFSATFSWQDAPPTQQAWVFARVERADETGRVQLAAAPVTRLSEGAPLQFASVPHGGPYWVVVEVRDTEEARSRPLYFGESEPFQLRAGEHTEVRVALALTAAPSSGDGTDPDGAVSVVESNDQGYVQQSSVTVRLAPRGATRVIAANDFALSKGRQEIDLASLTVDGDRYELPWNLDAGLCASPPCAEGPRSVFVEFINDRGYASEVVTSSVVLDRTAPDVAAASLAPSPARAATEVTLVVNPTEPLASPPRLKVSPRDPGFAPFERLPGGGYVSAYVTTDGEGPRERFEFTVELTDLAGNAFERELDQPLLVDVQAPGLMWGASVDPAVVRSGEDFSLSFELDEVPAEVPLVRVGNTVVACGFDGPTRLRTRCTHTAARTEGSGERQISIEARDLAGNVAVLAAGQVLYDTLPFCGDGVVTADQLEDCDEGSANSNAPDAACRPDCRPQRCGDGIVDPAHGEACDDGNNNAGDGCASDCSSDESCGNGILEEQFGEQCDDGNFLSRDGCSSRCQGEGIVHDVHGRLPAAERALGTYDTLRQRVVVFSDGILLEWGPDGFRRISGNVGDGTDAEAITYDSARQRVLIWGRGSLIEWDGTSWSYTEGQDRLAPADGANRGLVYVPSRQHTLVFGGESRDVPSSELWAWDGQLWDNLTPTDGPSPSPRTEPGLAYDPTRDRVVLFGGSETQDTWEWDGERWELRDDGSTLPVPLDPSAVTYDASRRRVVALSLGDTVWEWDGTQWTGEVSAQTRPAVGSMVYDARHRRLVAVIGTTASSEDRAWVVRDEGWLALPAAPPPSLGPAVAYETGLARAVSFGGYAPPDLRDDEMETYYDHTWVRSTGTWSPLEVEGASPPPRAFAALAYDPLRDVSVLFGGEVGDAQPCDSGCATQSPLGDTWELRGNRWQAVDNGGEPPPASASAEMFYDAARGRVTLFAPTDEGVLGVWHWQGAGWQRAALSGSVPEARKHFAVAYDPVRERAVLFGGEQNIDGLLVTMRDTWEWDGAVFHLLPTAASPVATSHHGMSYHPARGRVVFYGGGPHFSDEEDAWEWDGTIWHRVATDTSGEGYLPFVLQHAMFVDPESQAVVSVGGRDGSLALGETRWHFESEMPPTRCGGTNHTGCPPLAAQDEVCLADVDGDGDGLFGCDDPDCYARCSSACNPLRMSCEDGVAHCGDGTCDSAEDCSLCPTDCGPCADVCGDEVCGAAENASTCSGDCQ